MFSRTPFGVLYLQVSSSKRLLIGRLYRSPSSSPLNNNRLVDLFDNVAAEQIDYKVLVGDFNCPDTVSYTHLTLPTILLV